jgi:hypothetical protein
METNELLRCCLACWLELPVCESRAFWLAGSVAKETQEKRQKRLLVLRIDLNMVSPRGVCTSTLVENRSFFLRDSSVTEISENAQTENAESASKRIVRCDVHPKGSLLNPVSFESIAEGLSEIFIEHSNQLYKLSRTRLDKLILTKATNP